MNDACLFQLPADVLDTSAACPQIGKIQVFPVEGEAVLDTTGASPQTGKPDIVFDLSQAKVLDTTKAAPLVGKSKA